MRIHLSAIYRVIQHLQATGMVDERNPQCRIIAELKPQFWENGDDSHKRGIVD